MTSHEVEHKSNNTVIELYLQFFDQLRVLSKMSVFIIYKLEEVNETQLLGWLMYATSLFSNFIHLSLQYTYIYIIVLIISGEEETYFSGDIP